MYHIICTYTNQYPVIIVLLQAAPEEGFSGDWVHTSYTRILLSLADVITMSFFATREQIGSQSPAERVVSQSRVVSGDKMVMSVLSVEEEEGRREKHSPSL